MLNFKDLLSGTKFEKKSECILAWLKTQKVTTYDTLQDLPIHGHFCGVDVYQVVSAINEAIKKQEEAVKATKVTSFETAKKAPLVERVDMPKASSTIYPEIKEGGTNA